MKYKQFSKVTAVLLAVSLALSLTACGSDAQSDPNAGVYTAVTAKAMGIEMPVGDLFGEGFSIELKDKGKCAITADGKKANGKWTLDGSAFTVKGGGIDCAGTLENGAIVLEDVMGMGVTLTLVREGASASLDTPASSDAFAPAGKKDLGNSGAGVGGGNKKSDPAAPTPKAPAATGKAASAQLTIPSTWYGVLLSDELNYEADVFGELDTDGKPYFELWESLEDFRGETDYSPIFSTYINEDISYGVIIPIADGEGWFYDHFLTDEDVAQYMGVYLDGMLYFHFTYDAGDGKPVEIEIYLRENGAAWNEDHDPLPPGYETYKAGF